MACHRTLILFALVFISLSGMSARAGVHGPAPSSQEFQAPSDSAVSKSVPGSGRDSRFRLGAGLVGGEFYVDNVTLLYLNLNYRVSLAISPRDEQAVGIGLEGGLNYLMPYLSIGPEVRLGNFAITGDMGATMIPGMTSVFPFANVGGGLISRHTGLGLEVNGGCLFVMGGADLIYPYLGVSASLR